MTVMIGINEFLSACRYTTRFAQAFRARRSDEVLTDHFEHAGAHVSRQHRMV